MYLSQERGGHGLSPASVEGQQAALGPFKIACDDVDGVAASGAVAIMEFDGQ